MCRQAISDSHWSHDDQVADVMRWLSHNAPNDYAYLVEQFPGFHALVWSGAWVDTVASAVDAEYMCWVCDAIEQDTAVFWADGEPWVTDNSNCGNDHLDVCADCLVVAVNGDTSGITDPIREDQVLLGIERYSAESGRQLVAGSDNDCGFSRQPCELCRDSHHGDRYELVGI